MPLLLYGPFLYQNFWIILLTNIDKVPRQQMNDWYREFRNILITHYPEYQ